jgi:AcrR family transcriptional regulator
MLRGRPREFDRGKALMEAMLLFWRKGFHATSLRDLGDALDIRMPSLYAAFGSKEALYVEAVDQYMGLTRTLLWKYLSCDLPAREAIKALLLATAREVTNCDIHPVGCMVSFVTIDEDMPATVVATIRNARNDWHEIVRKRLEKAIADGELVASSDPDTLSRFYVGIVQSIGIQAHDGAPYEQLEKLIEVSMSAWPTSRPANEARRKSETGRRRVRTPA